MPSRPDPLEESARSRGQRAVECLALAGTFARAALCYWLLVFPRVCSELRGWHRRAARIGDPALLEAAQDALGKRGNVEGAAAFAAIVPGWRHRRAVVRALVAFQVAYDYVDLLAERSHPEPVLNATSLHTALLIAVEPGATHHDYYSLHPQCADGGYLAEVVDACRTALSALPSSGAVAVPVRRCAARILAFQSLSLGERHELERWARAQPTVDGDLAWWEAAAAAGSSLAVHALIAAAAAPSLSDGHVAAIEAAYFPWVGSLHSLLDSTVDVAEDAAAGQLSLVGCYRSAHEAGSRMRRLTRDALRAGRALPKGRSHAVLITAMACSYLSTPEASAPEALALLAAVRDSLGGLAGPALMIFRVRHLAGRFAGGPVGCTGAPVGASASAGAAAQPVRLGEGERGVGAGAA